MQQTYNVILAGNPNVGKSTIFNALTGMKQHTGNWSGKTVVTASGCYTYKDDKYNITDLPGVYSLLGTSPDEEAAKSVIDSRKYDCVVIAADAANIERNLDIILQICDITDRIVVCLNLCDEAKKRGISVSGAALSKLLSVPVIKTAARSGIGLEELKKAIYDVSVSGKNKQKDISRKDDLNYYINRSHQIAKQCLYESDGQAATIRTDKIITSKKYGIPIMLILLTLIFFITITGANVPSQFLENIFSELGVFLRSTAADLHIPQFIRGILIDGMYTTLTQVISVMLPPMAIFFPMFALLEDMGYLPRIAFMSDPLFSKAGTDGKNVLPLMMGLGCNACGVTGCRIIDCPQKRSLAMMTNSFIPCNGRFPILIMLITSFLISELPTPFRTLTGALILTASIILSVGISLFATYVISHTFYKSKYEPFIMELPPYRRPQILKTIVRSIFDKTLGVLCRAVLTAVPAGAVIWLLSNIRYGDTLLISYLVSFLDPIGKVMGLDGAIITGFILGFPANEIVLPIILMIYRSAGDFASFADSAHTADILISNGWTAKTAICMILFTLMHFPCSTTVLTIYKETKSLKQTAAAILLPAVCGILCCIAVNMIMSTFA